MSTRALSGRRARLPICSAEDLGPLRTRFLFGWPAKDQRVGRLGEVHPGICPRSARENWARRLRHGRRKPEPGS